MTIKVLVVDDHTLFRNGIKLLLQRHSEFDVVGEASDGLEGVKRARQLKPDVILMDLNMPGLSGLEAMQLILEDLPQTAILMLTVSEAAEDLTAALHSGAQGYLLKNIEADYLTWAIRRVHAGDAVVADPMKAKLVAQIRLSNNMPPVPKPVATKLDTLTPREREAVACLVRGQSNKIIARQLDVTESTVKIHVQNILKKLQLNSRAQVAVLAFERGLGR